MSFVVIPNVSEGRRVSIVRALRSSITDAGAKVLDTHTDASHNRTVFTVAGEPDLLLAAMEALALASALTIDLSGHAGVHPRVGALDVCPFAPLGEDLKEVIGVAREAGRRIGELGIPVYFYGAASESSVELPDLRRGGIAGLVSRARHGAPPDQGPKAIDPRVGAVCVGARPPLIAFNVWLDGNVEAAKVIASKIRHANGGLPGVRAIGVDMGEGRSQVSMNLTDPAAISMEDVLEVIERSAQASGIDVVATEIVGLPPERYMPSPNAKVTRLLKRPGHSLESRLQGG